MKKLLLLAAVIGLFSCTTKKEPTLEEKAKSLIEENLKKTMYDWSSYEFVSMSKLDSVFTDYESTDEGKRYTNKIDSIKSIIKEYEFDSGLTELYSRKRIKEMRDSIAILKQMQEKINGIISQAKKNYIKEFDGYRVKFVYRGNNRLGAKTIGKSWYFFNKDITEITNEF